MDELVCYCFNYTKSDIREDVLRNKGRSTIIERILATAKEGKSQCKIKNPSGR